MPVPPPTSAIGLVPGRLEATEEAELLEVTDVQAVRGGIEPDVEDHSAAPSTRAGRLA